MSNWCYYINPTQDPGKHGGFVPSIVKEGEAGHSPLSGDPDRMQTPWVWGKTLKEAKLVCAAANAEMGVDSERALMIVASSMRASGRRR